MRAALLLLLGVWIACLTGCRAGSPPAADPYGPPIRVGGTPPAEQLPPGKP